MSSLQLTRVPSPEPVIRTSVDLTAADLDSRPAITTEAPGTIPSLPTDIEEVIDARRAVSASFDAVTSPFPVPPRTAPRLLAPETTPHTQANRYQPVSLAPTYEAKAQRLSPIDEKAGFAWDAYGTDEQHSEKGMLLDIAPRENRPWTSRLGALDAGSRAAVESLVQRVDTLHPLITPSIKLAAVPATLSLSHAAIAKTVQYTSNLFSAEGSCQISMLPFAAAALLPWLGGLTIMMGQRYWYKESGPLSDYRRDDVKSRITNAHLSLSTYFSMGLMNEPALSSHCSKNTLTAAALLANDAAFLFGLLLVAGVAVCWPGDHNKRSTNASLIDNDIHRGRLLEEGHMYDCSHESHDEIMSETSTADESASTDTSITAQELTL